MTIPKDWTDTQIYLSFEGVDDHYEAFVNGTKIGSGGDIATKRTAFDERASFKITRRSQAGREMLHRSARSRLVWRGWNPSASDARNCGIGVRLRVVKITSLRHWICDKSNHPRGAIAQAWMAGNREYFWVHAGTAVARCPKMRAVLSARTPGHGDCADAGSRCQSDRAVLLNQFRSVRSATESLCRRLSPEDCNLQSMNRG